ncbi:MAG: cell division protein [Moraxellaceae bacterium]|jgi:cell division septation protein DedD|nr:cell division protein [Moraxellaceae bacterium]
MEKEIKQRLLGGLVLVAGAALFLPVLLDGSGASLTVPPMPAPPQVAGVDEIAPQLDQNVAEAERAVSEAHAGRDEASAAEATAAASEIRPDSAEPAAAEAGPVQPDPAAAAVAAERERLAAEKAAAEKAAAEKARLEAAAKAKAATKPATAAGSKPAVSPPAAWVVQVASLSSRDKAEALVQKLRRKNYPAVISPQGSMWKVMVGPELSREVADATKAKLAADPELRLNGWVQSYKP